MTTKTPDLSKFLHVMTAKTEIENEIAEVLTPYQQQLDRVRAESDAIATAIGEAYGSGTFDMPDGKRHKVRAYRKDDTKGRTGFYFLAYEEKAKGVKDLSKLVSAGEE